MWVINRDKYVNEDSPGYTTRGVCLTGRQRLKERILRALNPNDNIWCVYLPIEEIVDYDLENMKADINTDKISKLRFLQSGTQNNYINDLAKIAQWYLKSESGKDDTKLTPVSEADNHDMFTDLLLEFFEMVEPKNQTMMHTNKQSQNNLKYLLMMIKLAADKLDVKSIDKYARDLGYTSFYGLLSNIRSSIDSDITYNLPKTDPEVDQSWQGTRYGAEVPMMKHKSESLKKDLSYEIINRNFMWCDDYYFSYDNWTELLKNTYDGFNMQVKAPEDIKSNEKYFYQDQFRRTLSGIFPDGKGLRSVYKPEIKSKLKNAFLTRDAIAKNESMEWTSSIPE